MQPNINNTKINRGLPTSNVRYFLHIKSWCNKKYDVSYFLFLIPWLLSTGVDILLRNLIVFHVSKLAVLLSFHVFAAIVSQSFSHTDVKTLMYNLWEFKINHGLDLRYLSEMTDCKTIYFHQKFSKHFWLMNFQFPFRFWY